MNKSSDPVAAAMMTVLKARGLEESLTHFRFEGEFCMSCDWRRIDLKQSSQVVISTYFDIFDPSWSSDSMHSMLIPNVNHEAL